MRDLRSPTRITPRRGFDRDYILLKIFQFLETPIEESEGSALRLEEWVGLNEFDPITRQEWALRIGEAFTLSDYQKLLKTIERAKTRMLSPQIKVASQALKQCEE